jgi:hypothetical protein
MNAKESRRGLDVRLFDETFRLFYAMDAESRQFWLLAGGALICGELSGDDLDRITAAPDAKAAWREWYARIGAARRARITWAIGAISNKANTVA